MKLNSSPYKNSSPNRTSLAKRLIAYMILFSASITLITTGLQLYNEYKRDLNSIESLFEQVEKVHLRSFTHSLWATNYSELRVQMEGLVTLPNVIYASVVYDGNLLVETGQINSKNIIQRQYMMEYEFLNKKNTIGKLTVVTTLDNIYANLYRDATNIFINNALRTLLVVIFIYYIFHSLISRHIARISEHFQKISLNKRTHLVLDRNPPAKPDELDFLVSSANEMQDRIIDSYKAFHESEKKYRTLTAVAPVGLFYTDALGECLYVNEKWLEITGMSEAQALGNGWLQGLHPQDKERVLDEWAEFAKQNASFKLEYRFKKGPNINWVLGQAIAEKNNRGKVIGYVGTITDITERKKAEQAFIDSEEKLRIIHSQVPGIVYQFGIDANGNRFLPYVSPVVENYIGLSAITVMKDVNKWFGLTHPDDYPSLEKSILESLISLEKWEWKGRFIRPDGEIVWLHGTSIPKRMEDGSTLWNGFFIDVTEKIRTDEVVRHSQKMDALGKLTGGIAHDYNNMLGVVLGYAELLSSKLSGQPNLQNYVNKITHAGERGAKLTKRLLAFTKNKSTDAEIVCVNHLLKDAKHMLEKTLTARITLQYKIEGECWPVYLDESELEDAILNLSINAMHAIDGNGELIIASKNIQMSQPEAESLGVEAGDYVRMVVSDNGHGMNELTSEKVFDPFYTTKGDKGTGLGLTQVYGFVRRCGGVIKIESELNIGTKVFLYFKRYKGDGFIEMEQDSNDINLQGKETILVVDDEPALLELTSEILSLNGYKVLCADSAHQALEILAVEKINILVSDVIMPKMDGYALAAVVREKYPLIKIQLMSGYTNASNNNQDDNHLYDSRLHKPFNAKVLLESVRLLLEKPSDVV